MIPSEWRPELVRCAVLALATLPSARGDLLAFALSLALGGHSPGFALGARDYLETEASRGEEASTAR